MGGKTFLIDLESTRTYPVVERKEVITTRVLGVSCSLPASSFSRNHGAIPLQQNTFAI